MAHTHYPSYLGNLNRIAVQACLGEMCETQSKKSQKLKRLGVCVEQFTSCVASTKP
jgi:hypothetical protein